VVTPFCREQARTQAGQAFSLFCGKILPLQNLASGVECSRLDRTLVVRCVVSLVSVALMLAVSARGQEFVPANEQAAVNHLFEATLKTGDGLKCDLQHLKPELDFAFRFDIHYILGCGLSQFQPGSGLAILLRIKAEGTRPVLLRQLYRLQPVPPEIQAKTPLGILNQLSAQISGTFSAGEGKYSVELLVVDEIGKSFRRQWPVEVERNRREHGVPLALGTNIVLPTTLVPWDGMPVSDNSGLRLTILMHAAPMNQRSVKLYAWDRLFLLETLLSVVRQIPYSSLRVVAFNLGQQKELFRDENFNFKSLDRLAETLRKTEMATVPAQALESNAQSEMLARLSQEELTREVPSDAVIFLGPSCRFDKKVPKEVLKTLEGDGRRFFYLEYFPGFMRGGEFPDAIHLLTRDLHGTVFPIHSAPELASSVQRMLLQIKPLDRNLGMASKAGGGE